MRIILTERVGSLLPRMQSEFEMNHEHQKATTMQDTYHISAIRLSNIGIDLTEVLCETRSLGIDHSCNSIT